MKLPTTFCAALLVAATAGAQSGTLDQVSPFASEVTGSNSAGYNFDASFLVWQATTEAGISGTLEGIELELTGDPGASCNVDILLGGPWNTGTPAFSGTVTKATASTEIIFLDMTSAAISLTAGDIYSIQITGTDTGLGGTGSYETPANTYYLPELWLMGNLFGPEWRIGFHTYILEESALELAVHTNPNGWTDFFITNATPVSPVALVYAFGTGSHSGTNPITGNTVITGLSSTNFTVGATMSSDGGGVAFHTAQVPSAAIGLVCVQAIDLASDAVSNVHCF